MSDHALTEAANARCIRDLKKRLAEAEQDRDRARGWANSWHHVLDTICVILEIQALDHDEVAGAVRSKFEEIRSRLAEAERDRDRYASDAGERAAKLDAAEDRADAAESALAEAQQERDEAKSLVARLNDVHSDVTSKARLAVIRAESLSTELAKARKALTHAITAMLYAGSCLAHDSSERAALLTALDACRAALAPAQTEGE